MSGMQDQGKGKGKERQETPQETTPLPFKKRRTAGIADGAGAEGSGAQAPQQDAPGEGSAQQATQSHLPAKKRTSGRTSQPPARMKSTHGPAGGSVREDHQVRGFVQDQAHALSKGQEERGEAYKDRLDGEQAVQAVQSVPIDDSLDAGGSSAQHDAQPADAQAGDQADVFSEDEMEDDAPDGHTQENSYAGLLPHEVYTNRMRRGLWCAAPGSNTPHMSSFEREALKVRFEEDADDADGTGTLFIRVKCNNLGSGQTVTTTQNKTTGEIHRYTQDEWRHALLQFVCCIMLNGWPNVMGSSNAHATMSLADIKKDHPMFYLCCEAHLPLMRNENLFDVVAQLHWHRCAAFKRLCELAGLRQVAQDKTRVTPAHDLQAREAQAHENAAGNFSNDRQAAKFVEQQKEISDMTKQHEALMLDAMFLLMEFQMMPKLLNNAPENVIVRDKKHVNSNGEFAWTVMLLEASGRVHEFEAYTNEAKIKTLFSFYHDYFNHVSELYDKFFEASELPFKVERCVQACEMTIDAVRLEIVHNEEFDSVSFGDRWDKSGLSTF